MTLRAVLFDVDFTLARPGPELGPEGYRRLGERFGLTLDPARYEDARAAARESLQHHPELRHDEEIWVAFTAEIIRGMGGSDPAASTAAVDMTRAWNLHHNFELYEDALPVIEELRGHGLKIGLVSNTGRDLDEFLAHHVIPCDAALASGAHGWVKPHREHLRAVLSTPRRGAGRGGDGWRLARRTTSKARGRSACGPSCSTATDGIRSGRTGWTTSGRCLRHSESAA